MIVLNILLILQHCLSLIWTFKGIRHLISHSLKYHYFKVFHELSNTYDFYIRIRVLIGVTGLWLIIFIHLWLPWNILYYTIFIYSEVTLEVPENRIYNVLVVWSIQAILKAESFTKPFWYTFYRCNGHHLNASINWSNLDFLI